MRIEKNKVVVLTYTATDQGMIVDRATEDRPLDYIQGFHMLLPKFEEQLEGKEAGDSFEFDLSPEEGYGDYDPKHRFDIPKESFSVDGKLREDLLVRGRIIPMLNGAGEVCMARIIEIKDNAVTVDFNHPMAGKTLRFSGRVLSVRDATEKELREGLHGEFLPPEEHHCRRHGKGGCCHYREEGEGPCHHEEGDGCCHHEEGEGCCGRHGENEGCCHQRDQQD